MKYILISLCLAHFSLSAQINDLLKDDNVVWIGAFTTNFVVEAHEILDTSEYINSSKLLKFINPTEDPFLHENTPFESQLLQYENRLNLVYEDSTFTRKWKYYSIDTLEFIDSITLEKKSKIVFAQWVPLPPPRFYQTRQVLFYDKKRMNFGLRVLSISFIQKKRNEFGEIIGLYNEGWIKPININGKKIDFNDPNITIIRRLETQNNSPSIDVDMKILKNTVGDICQTMIDDFARDTSIYLYKNETFTRERLTKLSHDFKDSMLRNLQKSLEQAKMPKDSSKNLISKKDSVKIQTFESNDTTYFPDFKTMGLSTNDAKVPINVPPISDTSRTKNNVQTVDDIFPDFNNSGASTQVYMNSQFGTSDSLHVNGIQEISKLRLVQDWYWDEKLKNICIRLHAIAPLIKVYNEDGEFIFDTPLFYRLNE